MGQGRSLLQLPVLPDHVELTLLAVFLRALAEVGPVHLGLFGQHNLDLSTALSHGHFLDRGTFTQLVLEFVGHGGLGGELDEGAE